jgi:2-haloacid dehalogenase
MIDALVFDAYGTIFDVDSVSSQCETLWPGRGAAVSRTWRSKQLEYSWLRSLMGRYADFETVTTDALRYACQSLDLQCTATNIEQLLFAYRNLTVFPDAVAALRDIGSRKRAILSNGSPAMLQAVVRNGGLEDMFDAVLSVDTVRVYKPDPRVYRHAVDALQVDPVQTGFVSASSWDICGARSFGFQTFWINRNAAPREYLGTEPDYVVTALTGVVQLLH